MIFSKIPLIRAVQKADIETIQALLKSGEDLRVKDRFGRGPIHYCVDHTGIEVCQILIEADNDLVDLKDDEGLTCLHLAVISGNKDLVEYLLKNGANIESVDSEGHSVLHWATVCGNHDLFEILKESGADFNAKDKHGGRPLHYAAQLCGKDSEVSKETALTILTNLISFGADVNATDDKGRTPLIWAANVGSLDGCKTLTDNGAMICTKDNDQLTSLHCAAAQGYLTMVEELVKFNSDLVKEQDINGCTPLFYSINQDRVQVSKFLLNNGSDPSHRDFKDRLPAHCASAIGSKKCLEILIEHMGLIWSKNRNGEYPVHEAALAGHWDVVEFFFNKEPKRINVSNKDGRTCLHIAASSGNLKACKYLVDNGANIRAIWNTFNMNKSPYDVANEKKHKHCARLLKYDGCKMENINQTIIVEEGENSEKSDILNDKNNDQINSHKEESINEEDEEVEGPESTNKEENTINNYQQVIDHGSVEKSLQNVHENNEKESINDDEIIKENDMLDNSEPPSRKTSSSGSSSSSASSKHSKESSKYDEPITSNESQDIEDNIESQVNKTEDSIDNFKKANINDNADEIEDNNYETTKKNEKQFNARNTPEDENSIKRLDMEEAKRQKKINESADNSDEKEYDDEFDQDYNDTPEERLSKNTTPKPVSEIDVRKETPESELVSRQTTPEHKKNSMHRNMTPVSTKIESNSLTTSESKKQTKSKNETQNQPPVESKNLKSESKKKVTIHQPNPPSVPKSKSPTRQPIRQSREQTRKENTTRPKTAPSSSTESKSNSPPPSRPKTTSNRRKLRRRRSPKRSLRIDNHIQEAVRLYEIKKLSLQELNRTRRSLLTINHQHTNNSTGKVNEKVLLKGLLAKYNERILTKRQKKRPSAFNSLDDYQKHLRKQIEQLNRDEQLYSKEYNNQIQKLYGFLDASTDRDSMDFP